uniref:Centrosomal protein n=1 Tax=Anthurium amnicola TaxID=1678845 RepID=A0A1D1XV10_9ARAE
MVFPPETEEYIRESIENSLGLPVSAKTLRLKLLASEDERRRLRDKIFLLQGLLSEADSRLEQYRAEASMNAQGLRRCIEEKEAVASGYADLVNHCAKLQEECTLYERDIEMLMESCDDLARENEELRVQLKGTSVTTLISEVESLTKDKEHLKINLDRAEEEVKVLFEENNILAEENKKLLNLLNRERHKHGSGGTHSASASAKRKRNSSPMVSFIEKAINFHSSDLSRQPLSPLQLNSPNSRMHKK